MTLDTLLTEAAEAGPPPRFDETDIARRVGGRHRRRRLAVTGVASLIVVAGGLVGLALAARGGDGDGDGNRDEMIGQPTTRSEVPLTADALVGSRWVEITEPGFSGPADWLEFGTDGQARAEGCGRGVGPWSVADGRLSLALTRGHLDLCLPNDDAYRGSATLYDDGTLRFEADADPRPVGPDGPQVVELRRLDRTGRPPEGRRQLIGTWSVGDAIDLEFTEQYVGASCTSGRWDLDDDRLAVEPMMTDCAATLPPAVEEEVGAWLPFLEAVRVVGDRLLVASPDVTLWLAPSSEGGANELAGTRWFRAPEEASSVPQASFIEFGDGTYRMAVTCGTVDGTYSVDGSRVTMTRTGSDLGAACDVFRPDIDVAWAEVDSGRLTIHLAEVPGVDSDPLPTRSYVRSDTLDVPQAEDLLGSWGSPLEVAPGIYRDVIQFRSDGSATLERCDAPVDWMLDDRLRIVASDADCLLDFGLRSGTNDFLVRSSGDVLYLDPTDGGATGLLARSPESVDDDTALLFNGPDRSLLDAYDAMGVETCCRDDGNRVPGFVWDGYELNVTAVLDGAVWPARPRDPIVVLDGRARTSQDQNGGRTIAFLCGGYRFGIGWGDAVPEAVLVEATGALLDELPCAAVAPTT